VMERKEEQLLDQFVPEESVPLNEEELAALGKLKASINEIDGCCADDLDEIMLIRFIRGYWQEKDREATTTAYLQRTIKFREEWDSDAALGMEFDREAKFFEMWPQDYHGCDKRGHPLYIEKTSAVDPELIFEEFSVDELKKFHIQMQEKLNFLKEKSSEETGHMTYKAIVIMDMSDLSRKHLGKSFRGPIQEILQIDQYYYPESLYKLYLINCPLVFRMLWAVIKPWLHPLTAARINILGDDYMPTLLEFIDADQLPRYFGGNCQCCTDEPLEQQWEAKLEKARKFRNEYLAEKGNQ